MNAIFFRPSRKFITVHLNRYMYMNVQKRHVNTSSILSGYFTPEVLNRYFIPQVQLCHTYMWLNNHCVIPLVNILSLLGFLSS